MNSCIIFLSLTFLCINKFSTEAAPEYLYHVCPNTSHFAPDSISRSKFHALVSSLSAAAAHSIDGFANATTGLNPPDQAYGFFLCRGDLDTTTCSHCAAIGLRGILERCQDQRVSAIWYDQCMLRYSNRAIFLAMEPSPNWVLHSNQSVADPARFMRLLGETLNQVAAMASAGGSGKKVAVAEANFTSSQKLYALVQCAPYLTASDCFKCLKFGIANLSQGKQGGRFLAPSCNLRYELYQFYNGSALRSLPVPPSPAPARTPPAPVTGPQAQSNKSHVIIILVASLCLCLGLVCLLCACCCRRQNEIETDAVVPGHPIGPLEISMPGTGTDGDAVVRGDQIGPSEISMPGTETDGDAVVRGDQIGPSEISIVAGPSEISMPGTETDGDAVVREDQIGPPEISMPSTGTDGDAVVRGDQIGPSEISIVTGPSEISIIKPVQFTLDAMRAATENFSGGNKLGSGGFGDVFKGKLPDGPLIAVKRQSPGSKQGAEEFKNEVASLANVLHQNLVRLLGFCLESEERLLVYEFVQNGSLDHFLFDPQRSKELNWPTRYQIACGIARGMHYLHEESQSRIIHRDLKASNILLDCEMIPKISDFGMARIFGEDQSWAITCRLAGTIGYMAPEYARCGHFSVKSDVYSFGVLLLELVSGKKNRSFYTPDGGEGIAFHAWNNLDGGTPLAMLDPAIGDAYSEDQVVSCLKIGVQCAQEDPIRRPPMEDIVTRLSSHPSSLELPPRAAIIFGRAERPMGEPEPGQSRGSSVPLATM